MTVVSIQNFAGMSPMKDASVLPDNAASYCTNAYLYSGVVKGFGATNPVHTLVGSGIKSVYRIPSSPSTPLDFPDSLWLEFQDPFISVIRSPVIEDQYKRYYFFPSDQAAPGSTPYYNTLANLLIGAPGYTIGLPDPAAAPTVSYAGGTPATTEVRSYVYTWVSSYGEEGPPSAPGTLSGTVDGSWTIIVTAPTTADTTNRSLTKTNIYRTVTDSTGVATYYLVTTIPIAQLALVDNALDASITSNQALQSTTWTGPPSDLQGVVAMANGILAGWSNSKEVWFSEPYLPHAWPSGYAVTVDAPIVALAAVGTSLVILTENTPQIASGVAPSQMTLGKIASSEPCVARGSVVPAGEGVYYASPNGLILVSTLGTMSPTQPLISKEYWNSLGLASFAASKYAMAYVAFFRDSALSDNGIIIDHVAMSIPISNLSFGQTVENVYRDELSGSTFVLTATEVSEWNPAAATTLDPYVWQSKEWRLPFAESLVGGVVYFDVPPTLTIPTPASATRNTSQTQTFNPATQYLLLRVYADDRLILVREIQEPGEIILFPAGFKATYWKLRFEGQVDIKECKFATSIKELMKV